MVLHKKYIGLLKLKKYNKMFQFNKYKMFVKLKGVKPLNLKTFTFFLQIIKSKKFLVILKKLNRIASIKKVESLSVQKLFR